MKSEFSCAHCAADIPSGAPERFFIEICHAEGRAWMSRALGFVFGQTERTVPHVRPITGDGMPTEGLDGFNDTQIVNGVDAAPDGRSWLDVFRATAKPTTGLGPHEITDLFEGLAK